MINIDNQTVTPTPDKMAGAYFARTVALKNVSRNLSNDDTSIRSSNAGQERAGALMERVVKNLFGGALLNHSALIHEDDPICRFARKIHFVADNQHRHTA